MKKRFVLKAIPVFLLALLMICPLLTACQRHGGGDDTSGGTSGGTGTSSPDTTVVTLPDTESGKLLQTFIDAAYASGSGLTALDDNAKKLVAVWSEVASDAEAVMNSVYTQFASGDVSYERLASLLKSFMLIDAAQSTASSLLSKADSIRAGQTALEAFNAYVAAGKYMLASREAAQLAAGDNAARTAARAVMEAHADDFKAGITAAVTEYMVRYEIPKGKSYLSGLSGLGLDAHVASESERLEAYRVSQEDDLEKVTVSQTLENIYTHCMIAFPEINFASSRTYRKCGDDCLTYHESMYLLSSLYEKGYILIDANMLYDAETGKSVRTMMLPKGKKPLILTFDDVTYDSRKQGNGMVDKLIVDEDGYVCTYTKMKDGTEVISSISRS